MLTLKCNRLAIPVVVCLVFALFLAGKFAFAYTLIDTIQVVDSGAPRAPVNLTISPDGGKLYTDASTGTANTNEVLLLTIDISTGQVSASTSLGLGGLVFGVELTPNGTRAYLPVRGIINTSHPQQTSPRVDVVDTVANTHIKSIFTSGDRFGPSGVAVKPDDGSRVFVTHLDHRFFAIDTSSNNIIADVPSVIGLAGVAIVPDGSRAYAASRNNNTVTIIDTNTNSVMGSITRSNQGTASTTNITASPDGNRIYVTHSGSSIVSAIDVDPFSPTYHTEIAAIPTTGSNLLGMAVEPGSAAVLVASQSTDEVIVIDSDPLSANYHTQIGAVELPAGSSPWDVVFDNVPSGNAYVSLPGALAIGVLGPTIVDPIELIGDLIELVMSLNLQHGISNSLDAKLNAALMALDDLNENNDSAAINSLQAFINSVGAQSGNHIDTADANNLIAAAQAIIDLLSS